MKPKYMLALTSLIIIMQTKSQNVEVRSFTGSMSDSLKIMQLLFQAREVYETQNFDSVVSISEIILRESGEIDFIRGVGEAYFLKARALYRLGSKEKAAEMYQKAIYQFELINHHRRIASAYNNWGIILKAMGNFREAIEAGEKALEHVKMLPPDKLRIQILNNLGNSYQHLALFKKASNVYFESLSWLKIEQDSLFKKRMQAEVSINLGLVYFKQKLYEKSNEIFNEALAYFETQQTPDQLATIYNNLGILNTETKDFQKAIDYLARAHDIYTNLNSTVKATVCKANIGKIYLAQKNYTKAISIFEQTIVDFENLNAPTYLPSSYLGLGETLVAAEDLDRAEIALLKGLQIALKSGQRIKILDLYEGLISYHKSVGELDLALLYYDLYSALSRELNDQQIGRHIGQLELEELINRRDAALEILESEAALLEFQLSRQNILLALLTMVILLLTCVFTLIFRQHRLKARNRNIALEQKILRTQLNPHFIFNALGAIQHYMLDNAPEKAARYLSKFSALMRSILESSRTNRTSLAMEMDNMRNYLDLQSLRFHGTFDYTIDIDPGINPELVELPTQLIQPLLENSIEHGLLPNKGGELAIRFKNIQDYLIIEIMDDGVGLKHHKAVKTSNKTNASLGNTITSERIALINQKHKNKIRFSLTNKPGIDQSASGTLALLEIPLK